MDILQNLWMVKLSKWKEINGFDKTVVFQLPDFVSELLQKKHELKDSPRFAIIRRGIVQSSGKFIWRKSQKTLIKYSLLWYDEEKDRLFAVRKATDEKVWWILWNISKYVTNQWNLYTASKYIW